jgi:ABC-type branched-subunit amino acid transport system ATPase component
VPILERTLERASSVAAALELRGFGASPRMSSLAADCARPIVIRDAVFSFSSREPAPDARTHTRSTRKERGFGNGVEVRGFRPAVGSLTVVTGATGAGKSTLLRGLAGLLSHIDGGSIEGVVRIGGLDRASLPPRETSRFVGVVLQNPREAFATERVRDEIGLALELRGVASVIVAARVAEVAHHVGVSHLLGRPVRTLSAGEATLVAIAAAVVERPIALLVDEPLADLDVDARARVVAVLDALAHTAGVCVVVAEHRAAAFTPVADAWWAIEDGALVPGRAPVRVAAPMSVARRVDGAPQMLSVADLAVERDASPVVRTASLALHAGEIVALIGPNGAGKSTMFNLLTCTLPMTAGQVRFLDRDIAGMPQREVARLGLARTFQHVKLRPQMSLLDNVALGAHSRTKSGVLKAGLRLDRAEERQILQEARRQLDRIGLGDRAHELAGSLPLGTQRILEIARALAADPVLLVLDEPAAGLRRKEKMALGDLLRKLREEGVTILIVEHDMDFVMKLVDRLVVMNFGSKLVEGVPSAVRADERVQAAYLGSVV